MFTYAATVNGHLFLVNADDIEYALLKVYNRMQKDGFSQTEMNAASIKITDTWIDEIKTLR